MPDGTSPSRRPRAPMSTARTTSRTDTAYLARPCRAAVRPLTSATLTPARTANRAEARPPATCWGQGTCVPSIPGSMCVAIIPRRASARATSTPTTLPGATGGRSGALMATSCQPGRARDRLLSMLCPRMWDAATVYTIGHAARLTGVPSATLRVWERRYGLVRPVRSEGGYRLYDEQGLPLLRAMGALVAAGWSARQAAEHLRSEGTESPEAAGGRGLEQVPPRTRTGTSRRSSGGGTSRRWREGPLRWIPRQWLRPLTGPSLPEVCEQLVDTWLMPALQMLGTQWRAGRVDVAGEHVVSATLHRRLGAAMEAAPQPPRGPRVAVGLAAATPASASWRSPSSCGAPVSTSSTSARTCPPSTGSPWSNGTGLPRW